VATVATLLELGQVVARLCAPAVVPLPDVLAYTDMADLDPKFAAHLARDVYRARVVRLDTVALVALPPGATVLGGAWFATRVGKRLLAEQLPPHLATPDRIEALVTQQGPLDELEGPCLLVARFGAATWGHWIAEILPGLVLTERAFPGRYRFAVPQWDGPPDLPGQAQWGPRWARAIRQSLAGHGIDEDRLVMLDPSRSTRFRQMFRVTQLCSDGILHPEAADAMRRSAGHGGTPSTARRVALVRQEPAGRSILNAEEVYGHLAEHGFTCVAIGDLPYLDQVAVFRRAELVFGVLGSDLTGLLHAPDGVRVVSAAPAPFGDQFFYGLIQLRRGRYADLRGPARPHPYFDTNKYPFTIKPWQLDAALAALDAG